MPYPSVIDASTAIQLGDATLTQRVADYTQNGVWWVCCLGAGTNTLRFYYSTNSGSTWNYVPGMDLSAGSGYGWAMFIDADDFMHVLSSRAIAGSNWTWYYRGVPDTGRTFYTFTHTGSLDEVHDGNAGFGNAHDIVAFRDVTSGWHVWFTTGYYDGTWWYARMNHITLNSSGVPTTLASTFPDSGLNTNTGQWFTSIDFRHTAADPKLVQSSTPSVYLSMVQNSDDFVLYYKKYAYSAGVWTPGSTRTIDGSDTQKGYCVGLIYDGTRVMMASVRTGDESRPRVWERDEADTATTDRSPTDMGDGQIRAGGIGVDASGNVFITAAGATSQDVKKNRFNRGTVSWGGWVTVRVGTIVYESICQSRYLQPGVAGIMPVIYRDTNSSEVLFDTLWSANEAEASLQGVATATMEASIGAIGQAALQGVGSFTPLANLALAGVSSLQGVGTLVPTPLYNPRKDFTVYDGYIDSPASGTIPFIYFEDESAKAQTVSRPLRPPRTDTGADPTEVRPESGEIFSQQDFSHGAGQLYFHHEGRDVRRFLWSEGFEMQLDTVGQPTLLQHLNDVPTAATSSATIGKIEIFNDFPFVIDGANIKRGSGDFPGFWLNESPGGTPLDMVSSGEYLYAALGAAGIARRDTTGAWSIWNASVLATRIAWVKNRIMAADGPNVYEITDITRVVETLPAGWIFEAIFEAGGFIYAVANNASSGLSRISSYGLNSSGDAIEKKNETPFPRNQLMYSGRGFLGSVYIGGGIKNSSEGFDPVVYQAFPQENGALSYLKVNEGEGAGAIDLSVKAFEPIGEDIVFGWSLGSGFDFGARDGLAIHKPKVDAFLGYLKKTGPGAGRQVLGIALYRGRLLFTLKGDGLYYEDTGHFVAQAQLWTSVADWQTTTKKAWDLIQISHNRLPAGTSVRAEYSTRLPSEGAWNPGVFSNVTDSEVAESGFTSVSSQMLSLRLTSLANGAKTLAPSGLGFLVRSNVIPDHPEFGLTRYVRLVNKDRKDSDAPMVFTDVAAVRRKIHNLAYQWVTLYEPGVVWTLHVDSVAEVQPFLVEYDATQGEGQAQGYVVQLTMTGTRD